MKRRILVCLTAILTLCPAMHAQTARHQGTGTATDSAFIFRYPPCIQMFKENYRENRQTLRRLKHTLKTFTKGKDTLYVNGFSGECETDPRNRRTVFYRCNNLKGYLIKYYKLREKDFKTTNHPYLHPEAGDAVIISLYPPRTEEEAQAEATQPDTLQLPCRPQEITPEKEETDSEAMREPTAETARTNEPAPVPLTEPAPLLPRYLAFKTNLAAWAGTILNLAADVQVGEHLSVELPVLWCPWHIGSKHAVKTFIVQPEGRYWPARPGEGHFFGVHAHVGWFNAKWNRDRYQDTDRPLLGAGISYGYLLPFNEHWAGEFTLGAGYANVKYNTYYNINNGARIDTRTKNYWGITRIGVSVVYRLDLKK